MVRVIARRCLSRRLGHVYVRPDMLEQIQL